MFRQNICRRRQGSHAFQRVKPSHAKMPLWCSPLDCSECVQRTQHLYLRLFRIISLSFWRIASMSESAKGRRYPHLSPGVENARVRRRRAQDVADTTDSLRGLHPSCSALCLLWACYLELMALAKFISCVVTSKTCISSTGSPVETAL